MPDKMFKYFTSVLAMPNFWSRLCMTGKQYVRYKTSNGYVCAGMIQYPWNYLPLWGVECFEYFNLPHQVERSVLRGPNRVLVPI